MKDERERPRFLRFQQDWLAILGPQLSQSLDLVGLRVALVQLSYNLKTSAKLSSGVLN